MRLKRRLTRLELKKMAKKVFVSRMEDAPVLMKERYTEKQKKYIQGVLVGKSRGESLVTAGYGKTITPGQVETVKVKQGIVELLNRAGLSDKALVKDLKEGLKEANKFYGNGDNMVERPDYAIRHKYLETALKLSGRLQGETKQQKDPIQILIVDYDANKDKPTT
jgi:hypothetical protein